MDGARPKLGSLNFLMADLRKPGIVTKVRKLPSLYRTDEADDENYFAVLDQAGNAAEAAAAEITG